MPKALKISLSALAAVCLTALCWAITLHGARPFGLRQDRTVGTGQAAALAAWLVPGPPQRQMDKAHREAPDVSPLEFIGPFAALRDVQQVFRVMQRHRGVAQGVVCSVDWARVDTACDAGTNDVEKLATRLDVRLCRLTASKGTAGSRLPMCAPGGKQLLIVLLSDQASVVVTERRRACARRVCQIRGW